MNSAREDLLRPVLDSTQLKAAPYSMRATLLTSFFGGPFAAIGMVAANAYRLARLKREWSTIMVMLLLYVLGMRVLLHSASGRAFVEQWTNLISDYNLQILYRLVALAICGYGYLMHRNEHRGASLAGIQRPNPWLVAMTCGVAGLGLQILFLIWING
ncbi:MAG: hypothetical protein ABUL58_04505 [Steroidobacter sp.]